MTDLPPDDANLGRILGGQFRLDALLGQGGMGVVYRGVQLSVNRSVAIKLITANAPNQSELVKRFRREAEATARLSHPNTVRLFDFGVTESQELYMVMELLEGSDLSGHLQDTPRLPFSEAMQITRQILQALAEAHALGIVHRDLKPGNVFLARVHGGEVVAKVMDFGIAGIEQARETQKLTMTGAVIGTPAYMSPEQAQGMAVDARSDLYSLGVMLFEMLTGRPLFEGDTVVSLLLAHVTKPPPRLAEVQADFPQLEAAQSLLDQLLAKTPAERLPSAAAALAAIDALAAGARMPITTRNADAAVRPTALAATASPETPMGWTVAQAAPRKGPSVRTLSLGAGGVVLVVAALLVWPRHPPPPPASTVTPTPGAEPIAHDTHDTHDIHDTTEALYSVTLATSPKGARVLLGGAELGKTPYTVQFRHDTLLSVELPGYVSQTITVTKASDPTLAVELVANHGGAGVKPNEHTPEAHSDKPAEAPKHSSPLSKTVSRAEPIHEVAPAVVQEPTLREPEAPPPSAAGPRRTPIREVTRAVGGLVGSIFGRDDQRARREGLLRGAPAYPSVAAAQRAYSGGRISADAYEDAVWVLKARRKQRIEVEKDNLRRGSITAQEYEWRLGRIDAEFQGE